MHDFGTSAVLLELDSIVLVAWRRAVYVFGWYQQFLAAIAKMAYPLARRVVDVCVCLQAGAYVSWV